MLCVYEVMLYDENDIEEYADIAQSQLYWVSGYACPVSLQIAVDSELQDRKDSAYKIEKDALDRPANGRFIVVVRDYLRSIFDESDEELDVGYGVYLQILD